MFLPLTETKLGGFFLKELYLVVSHSWVNCLETPHRPQNLKAQLAIYSRFHNIVGLHSLYVPDCLDSEH